MGTTPSLAIPYVEPTDALANFPAQDKAQALRIDTALQQVSASYLRGAAAAIAAGTQVVILFDTAIRPLVGITYNAGTGAFTVPVDGRYLVVGTLTWQNTPTGAYRQTRLLKNGSLADLREGHIPAYSATPFYEIVRTIQMTAGETLQIAAYTTQATNLEVNSVRTYVAMEIWRLGP